MNLQIQDEAFGFNDFCALVGLTLIQVQRTEFIIQGVISHFDSAILSKDKRFKDLNPQNFLADSEEGKKSRRQTLGVLFELLRKNATFFDEGKLESYLSNRNKFVHSFWREEISGKQNTDNWNLQAAEFTRDFLLETLEWQKVFKGMMYLMVKVIAEESPLSEDAKKKAAELLETLEPSVTNFMAVVGLAAVESTGVDSAAVDLEKTEGPL
jgi:hypothetical protein